MHGSGKEPISIDLLLEDARSELTRLTPTGAHAAVRDGGAILIDIRSEAQLACDGRIPGARHFPRNVLEWRLDPASAHRDPDVARRDRRILVICDEGFQSSLAAATLKRFGLDATDVIGGFQAWRAAGLLVASAGELPDTA